MSVPRSVRTHRLWIERIEPLLIDRWDGATPHVASEYRDLLLEVLDAVCGRTGRELEPTEYVDVDVRLDAVRAEGRLLLEWAGVELAHAGDQHSWTSPRLTHCEVVAGAMLLGTEGQGETARRRITWEPGTVLRVLGTVRRIMCGAISGSLLR